MSVINTVPIYFILNQKHENGWRRGGWKGRKKKTMRNKSWNWNLKISFVVLYFVIEEVSYLHSKRFLCISSQCLFAILVIWLFLLLSYFKSQFLRKLSFCLFWKHHGNTYSSILWECWDYWFLGIFIIKKFTLIVWKIDQLKMMTLTSQ